MLLLWFSLLGQKLFEEQPDLQQRRRLGSGLGGMQEPSLRLHGGTAGGLSPWRDGWRLVPVEGWLAGCRDTCPRKFHPHPAVTTGRPRPRPGVVPLAVTLLQASVLWEEAPLAANRSGRAGLCLLVAQ